MILQGDARHLPFPDKTFHCVVTSPPYFGLRNYGDDPAEIGKESLPEYIENLMTVFAEVHRVLRDDGLFWLNVGDTAAGSGGAGGDYNKGGKQDGRPKWKQGESGLSRMQWCQVPSRLALALQAAGWLVRADVTWDKGKLRPEDLKHSRRPGVSSEKIYMLAKTTDHYFDESRLTERGNVWHFEPVKKAKGHDAPFPVELPLRCIAPSTRSGDLVLDPFVGSGTSIEAAELLGCEGFGVDLYEGE